MPAGRPRKDRPFAWPVDDARERLAKTVAWMESANALPDDVREFLFHLFDHAQGLDLESSKRLRRLATAVEEDESIAASTREFLLMMIARHDLEDASGRMQIRTLLGSAFIGKPPEAKKVPGGFGKGTPDGKPVPRPGKAQLQAVADELK